MFTKKPEEPIINVVNKNTSISKEDLTEIVSRYKNVYPSKSIFNGYGSKAIRKLITLSKEAEGDVSYETIFKLLYANDPARAVLFEKGKFPQNKPVIKATDKVILDLHNKFRELDKLQLAKENP